MKFKNSKDTHLIFVEKGEEIMSTITEYCQTNDIENGSISGIGAVDKSIIGAFDTSTKAYVKVDFPQAMELVSFVGNITMKDGIPFVHAHAVLGNHGMQVVGGHVFEMRVAVVGEFVVQKADTGIRRELDPKIGLATWCTDI